MNRRRFLQEAALWSLTFSLVLQWPFTCNGNRAKAQVAPARLPRARVGIARGKNYADLVRRSVTLIGGMQAFVRPGARVVIKPNIGWDRSPEQGANTHPLVVRTLAEMALEAGARQVRIFDRPCNEARRCYTHSGILPAIEALNSGKVRCEYIDRRKFVETPIPRGRVLKSWSIYRDALEADCYINVPVAKHHGLAGLTLGLKNSMGVLGGNRGRLHHKLDQNLADLATVIRPSLTVIDATRLLLRNGPSGGDLRDVRIEDTVLASADPVAADACATLLFGRDPDDLGSSVAAANMGLGTLRLSQIQRLEGP
ncbi:MAG: DUF362 domain-containing protein [Syntrophotalea acetylenica]|jgi:uncharacterized protein (DUF362 family)|uniref:Cytoplasmic protein n=1 Tax=Syntrophotalea acetylenica TaxID=29542 RepID=A0A1L3GDT8_SYNAC|nr:DUF362 domain-containing protein [Syntrophotalea acetylenica]APG24116.1 cytoplasmic protein [Syntrophotalea acetylenica]APG44698.1 cytoplasmic protein [Syntrophotalea acetylenica]MDD4456194.1 DUF362 domain-containing protein [Syntrophotalea acetylenica]MDY0262863.1 DUF362 domain-containing protein [Syntrophotalea acetylenica]